MCGNDQRAVVEFPPLLHFANSEWITVGMYTGFSDGKPMYNCLYTDASNPYFVPFCCIAPCYFKLLPNLHMLIFSLTSFS